MTESLVAHKRNIQCRTKVKTGCGTCRKRKIKCDENKPSCQKCVSTGRTCDGYESPFRFFTSQQPIRPPPPPTLLTEIVTPQDIDLLNRYFSTKTLFDVKLGCDEEAKQVLQASLTDPPIRHAVSALRALREDLETTSRARAGVGAGAVPAASVAQQQQTTAPSYGYDYGLQQYCMALGGLASNLSSSSSSSASPRSSINAFQLKSALLCCQIFISIEQVRGNYAAMAQHIIQGLGILRGCRARPNYPVNTENNLLMPSAAAVPCHGDQQQQQLPLLDVFIIKLFAAPCKFAALGKFADPPATTAIAAAESIRSGTMIESRDRLRTIAPDMRTELTRIAVSTLEFLDKVSHVKSAENALRLISEKTPLLDSLESWLTNLDLVQKEIRRPLPGPGPGPELLLVSFMRLFHRILKIILLGTLEDNSSPDLYAKLRTENDQLQAIASNVGEGVKEYYRTSSGTRSHLVEGERSKV